MKQIKMVSMLIGAAFMCLPMVLLASGSLMSQGELKDCLGPVLAGQSGYASFSLLPEFPTLRAYAELLLDTPQFFVTFWNSVKITGLILLGQCAAGIPAAWGFARFRFRGRDILFFLYLILMIMPFQVTMLSNYLVLNGLSLLDTHGSVILPGIFSTFPVFLLYRFFSGIPGELMEAARIDGAGELGIFLRIGLPLGSSGILSALVLGFLEYWNQIEQPMTFLKDKTLWPLSLYMPDITMDQAGTAFAAAILTLLPAVFVFFMGQDYLEQGIMASAVKE